MTGTRTLTYHLSVVGVAVVAGIIGYLLVGPPSPARDSMGGGTLGEAAVGGAIAAGILAVVVLVAYLYLLLRDSR